MVKEVSMKQRTEVREAKMELRERNSRGQLQTKKGGNDSH